MRVCMFVGPIEFLLLDILFFEKATRRLGVAKGITSTFTCVYLSPPTQCASDHESRKP